MAKQNVPSPRQRLDQALENFQLVGGRSSGRWLARSDAEPLFCLERKSKKELSEAVAEVIRSYAEVFYGIDDIDVTVAFEPIEAPTSQAVTKVPVRNVKPTHRLLPSLSCAAA